jgi:exonuclease VII large subunit
MTIIDSLTTTDKNEILKCERKYIEEQEFSLNKTLPSRTQKEWIQDHKEEISEWKKQYYLDHKEEMAEYKKQYYQDHKEELSEKKNEKIQCERCGAFSTRNHLTRHQRSKKCMNSHI